MTGKLILAKPMTFMNDSGLAVQKLAAFYKLPATDIYVIHDDLDIGLGAYKIQKGIGPKVHNGVNSIEEKLGTKEFYRVRVGVDNREGENRIPGEDYVLQNFRKEEKKVLKEKIDIIVEELLKKLIQ